MRTLSILFCAGILMSTLSEPVEAQTIRINMRKEKKEVSLNFLVETENLFAMTPDELEKTAGKKYFVWQDKDRTRARFNPDKYQYMLKDKKVGEVLINFKDGKLASAAVSVLNKGDEDELIDLSTFNGGVDNVKAILGAASGVKEEPRKQEEMISKDTKGAVWRSKKALYIGEWLYLPFKKEEVDGWIWTIKAHGEFVRIRIMPPQAQLGMQLTKLRVNVTRPVLASRVKREGKTKAVIDMVPMVDQGSKGYCAVASFERVLRYYGADVDMHDLANIAETNGGTDPQKMKNAVTKVSQKLSLHTRESFFLKRKQQESMFKEYNRWAEKEKKTKVDLEGGFSWKDVDFDVLKASRAASPDYKKFKQDVVTYINSGIPIMWALQLGLFWEDKIEESYEANRYATTKGDGDDDDKEAKEAAEERAKDMEEERKKNPKRPPPWMGGGHMRLIVGYDAAKQVIFYTDSWGPGHELKSMPIDQAWAVTLGMFVLEPQ
jgi:hypothetical protein